MMKVRFGTLERLVAVGTLMVFAACDPIRSVSGRVRSVPMGATATDQSEVRPLPGAIVKATCGEQPGMVFEDPFAGTSVLAITRDDGSFDYVDIGIWPSDCVLEFESGDGSHDTRRLVISDLCKQSSGDEHCLALENLTVDLVRLREPEEPIELRVRTTPTALALHTDEALTCRTPCVVQLTPGLHRLELYTPGRATSFWREQAVVTADTELTVRYEHHRSRQQAAGWFILPVAAASILLPVGLLRSNSNVLWTSAALGGAGGLGFLLVWKSDQVEVTVRKAPAQR